MSAFTGKHTKTRPTFRPGKAAFERAAAPSRRHRSHPDCTDQQPLPCGVGYQPLFVPSLYASQPLLLKTFADRLCIYHGEELIATHTRSYDRHQDIEDPEHGKELLDQRRAARDAKLRLCFYGFCPRAEEYYLQL